MTDLFYYSNILIYTYKNKDLLVFNDKVNIFIKSLYIRHKKQFKFILKYE